MFWFAFQKLQGLYQNKVNCSLTTRQKAWLPSCSWLCFDKDLRLFDMIMFWFTFQKQQGLYQNNVNCSLTTRHRLGCFHVMMNRSVVHMLLLWSFTVLKELCVNLFVKLVEEVKGTDEEATAATYLEYALRHKVGINWSRYVSSVMRALSWQQTLITGMTALIPHPLSRQHHKWKSCLKNGEITVSNTTIKFLVNAKAA